MADYYDEVQSDVVIAIAPEIQAACADKMSPTLVNKAKGGYCDIQGSNSWWYRTFLKYDLSVIPEGATIISAKMRVYDYYHNDNGAKGTTNISRITTDWEESSVSWNNQPSWEGTYLSENVSPPGIGNWSDWDITTLVQMWYDGTYPNYGVYIKNNNEGSYRYNWAIRNRYYTDANLASYIEIQYEVNQESEDTLYFVRRSSLTAIADSIRDKTGKADSLSLTQMAIEIDSIEAGIDTTDATATPDGIISGQTAYVNGQKITGTMLDNGVIASTMDGIDVKTITIPSGYTSGGSVSLDDTIDNEVDLQANLIEQIAQALQGKAGMGEGLPSVEGGLF